MKFEVFILWNRWDSSPKWPQFFRSYGDASDAAHTAQCLRRDFGCAAWVAEKGRPAHVAR